MAIRHGSDEEPGNATPSAESEIGDLPLAPRPSSFAESAAADEVSWGREARRGLLYDPLNDPREEAPPPAWRPAPADSSGLLFRLALSTAALLAMLVLARGFWWPDREPPGEAPEWAAPDLPAAPAPVADVQDREEVSEPVPEPGEPLEEEPTLVEELAGGAPEPAPAVAPRPRQPEPEIVEQAAPEPVHRREPSHPVPQRAAAPPEATTLARRVPAPWEEEPPLPGLLRPGPGVEEPVPLDLPSYSYPAAARGTGLRAEVRLALLVDERGKVIEARVREGAPADLGFAETALAVASQVSFQPASRYDVPGKMWTELILEFAEAEPHERSRTR